MKIDFKKINKLPPEQRVKALREIKGELSKVIKDKSEEVTESKDEIKEAQEFLQKAEEEMRVIEEFEIKAPKEKKVDIEKLFGEEKKPAKQKDLGEIAAEAAPKQPTQQEQQAYVRHLAQRETISSIYDRINAIREDVNNRGAITAYQQDRLNQFREALHNKEEAIKAGEYEPGQKAEHLLTAAEKAVMYATKDKPKTFYSGQRQ